MKAAEREICDKEDSERLSEMSRVGRAGMNE